MKTRMSDQAVHDRTKRVERRDSPPNLRTARTPSRSWPIQTRASLHLARIIMLIRHHSLVPVYDPAKDGSDELVEDWLRPRPSRGNADSQVG